MRPAECFPASVATRERNIVDAANFTLRTLRRGFTESVRIEKFRHESISRQQFAVVIFDLALFDWPIPFPTAIRRFVDPSHDRLRLDAGSVAGGVRVRILPAVRPDHSATLADRISRRRRAAIIPANARSGVRRRPRANATHGVLDCLLSCHAQPACRIAGPMSDNDGAKCRCHSNSSSASSPISQV